VKTTNIITFLLGWKRDQHLFTDITRYDYDMETKLIREFGVDTFVRAYEHCLKYKLLDGLPGITGESYRYYKENMSNYYDSRITFRGLWALFLLEKHILFSL
jgi:hypothetical protein